MELLWDLGADCNSPGPQGDGVNLCTFLKITVLYGASSDHETFVACQELSDPLSYKFVLVSSNLSPCGSGGYKLALQQTSQE